VGRNRPPISSRSQVGSFAGREVSAGRSASGALPQDGERQHPDGRGLILEREYESEPAIFAAGEADASLSIALASQAKAEGTPEGVKRKLRKLPKEEAE
jgi:hypothetical protein